MRPHCAQASSLEIRPSLHAQLGAVYLHSEQLAPEAVQQIWALGPNFMWVHDLPDATADQPWPDHERGA